MRPKFLKFERDQIAAGKFWIGINRSEKITKFNERGQITGKEIFIVQASTFFQSNGRYYGKLNLSTSELFAALSLGWFI
jgi:hypothetical protein